MSACIEWKFSLEKATTVERQSMHCLMQIRIDEIERVRDRQIMSLQMGDARERHKHVAYGI